ncbi:MAG: NUDIX hydrolase [Spirochaetia bacterium]|jgi:ADP-ribose pyrophosphatase YjhB (NUDIX family)
MQHSDIEPRQFFAAYDSGAEPAVARLPRNPYPGVVVLIEEADRVLLVRRQTGRFLGGRWCLPGGFIEYGENFLSAGLREVREETGLSVRIDSLLSVVSNFLAPRLHTLAVVLLAHPLEGGASPLPGDDADAVAWHPLSGPLPEMAFEADAHIISRYGRDRFEGAPVDQRFTRADSE